MKRVVTIALLICVIAANAAEAQTRLGLRAGSARVGSDGSGLESGPVLIGGLLGYEAYRIEAFTFGLEADANFTISSGDTDTDSKWDLTTYAAYLTARVGEEIYLAVKAGLLHERIDISGSPGLQDDDTGISAGAAVGITFLDRLAGEFELSTVEKNLGMISFALIYRF